MSLFIFLICTIFPASAVRIAMEPQNRVFMGASHSDGGNGFSVGIESRLTQLIYINMGGFGTFSENIGNIESDNEQDWVKMEHAIWAAPGWRIPHRYKENAWNWDIMARGGFACVFSSDAYRTDLSLVDPAGLAGIDFYLQRSSFGLRWTNKAFFYQPNVSKTLQSISTQRIQSAVELFWQWD